MNNLNPQRRELVKQLKEAIGLDDDNTALERLVMYEWDLKRAIEDEQNTLATENSDSRLRNEPETTNEQGNHETEALLANRNQDGTIVSDEAAKKETEMSVEGDQRLTQFPKYDWKSEDTRKWKAFAEEKLLDRCRIFPYDYQKFSKIQFSQVEEMIAMTIYGVDEKIAIQAVRTNNLLCAYNEEQRECARNVRAAIESISGDSILMQAIPILIRTDENVKARKTDCHFVSVFRVRSKNRSETDLFVDWNANIYKTWHSFIDNCYLPEGMMVYPKNGFLRERRQTIALRICDVQFGETPKCAFLARNCYAIQQVTFAITAASAILMFWNPLGWTGIALTAIRGTGILAASMFLAVIDRSKGQSFSLLESFPAFVSHIGKILLTKGIHHYLRVVAKQNRRLTAVEKIIINAFGDGFDESQISTLVCCVFSLVSEMRNCQNKQVFAMRLVVSCQEMFSCLLTPKKAERMLEEVREELSSEEFERICLLEEKSAQLELELNELRARPALEIQIERKLAELEECKREILEVQMRFQAMKSRELEQVFLKFKKIQEMQKVLKKLEDDCRLTTDTVKKLRKEEEIRLKKEEIAKMQAEIPQHQEEHLQMMMEDMSDSSAKEDFKEQVIRRCAERKNSEENHRIIQTIFEMDAEVLFKYSAATESTISFPSGERLNICINDQVDISAKNVSKMADASSTEKQELEKVMELTSAFRNGRLTDKQLIEEMKELMLSRENITKTELNNFVEWLKSSLDEEAYLFENVTPQQIRKLQTSLCSVSEEDQQLALRAAILLSKGLKLSLVNCLPDCVEIIISHSSKKTDELLRHISELEATGRRDEMNEMARMLGLPEDDVSILSTENFDLRKVFSCFLKNLGMPGTISEQCVKSCKERIEELAMNGHHLHPSETLSFLNPKNTTSTASASTVNTPQSISASRATVEAKQQETVNENFLEFYTNR